MPTRSPAQPWRVNRAELMSVAGSIFLYGKELRCWRSITLDARVGASVPCRNSALSRDAIISIRSNSCNSLKRRPLTEQVLYLIDIRWHAERPNQAMELTAARTAF